MCHTKSDSTTTEEPEVLFLRPELLLHPNIPKPLHGLAPRTLIPSKAWTSIRREAYAKNNYHCWACGVYRAYDTDRLRFDDESGETLDCHEFYRIDYKNHIMELVEFVALCKSCHSFVHSGRMNSMYEKGQLDEEDCYIITQHGNRVLTEAGLDPTAKEVDTRDYKKDWKKWRLVLDSVEYFSTMRDEWDWFKKYQIG